MDWHSTGGILVARLGVASSVARVRSLIGPSVGRERGLGESVPLLKGFGYPESTLRLPDGTFVNRVSAPMVPVSLANRQKKIFSFLEFSFSHY